ncbi:aminotransferase class V-fold PLP-dependent enzyme [Lachnoclostridium sp.]|uniref:aminotransferase class V-fold PLP-dependent enzyme n=1 Tax=Lachnoclostridium sp. TaxID=2028282 RepID=UPI0028A21D7F|nr:aminotransferase class V-fold PLP-dependent enzyme [Lachnoclostridium sp.]
MIYFDNAATSLHKPDSVADAVYAAIKNMGNSGRGSYTASLEAGRSIYATREILARLFRVKDASRIAFTSNATESLNIAIKGLLHKGDHVITTELEHNSVLRPLYELESRGVELTIIKSDLSGNIKIEEIKKSIKKNTKMVICGHSSNLTGNLIDIQRIGKLCREEKILFVVDAAQTAGVFQIDVEEQSIDVLCFTGHKALLGPQGTGGIYVREGIFVSPLKTGGSGFLSFSKTHPDVMPECLEAGTVNGHGIAGLYAGVSYIMETGIVQIREKEQKLMWKFYEGIKDIPNIKIYGDFTTTNRAAIVTFNIADYDSGEVSDQLAEEFGIYTRSGGHCAPLLHTALGTKEQGAVRFSFSHFNTEEEVDIAISAVKTLAIEI